MLVCGAWPCVLLETSGAGVSYRSMMLISRSFKRILSKSCSFEGTCGSLAALAKLKAPTAAEDERGIVCFALERTVFSPPTSSLPIMWTPGASARRPPFCEEIRLCIGPSSSISFPSARLSGVGVYPWKRSFGAWLKVPFPASLSSSPISGLDLRFRLLWFCLDLESLDALSPRIRP